MIFKSKSKQKNNFRLSSESGVGVTIVELLIVIAMIAVLTTIVLSNVTSYINVGKDETIKGHLLNVIVKGVVFYEVNRNYVGFCSGPNFTVPQLAITKAGGVSTCNTNSSNTAWCACSTLKVTAGNTFCVDYTGYQKQTGNIDGCVVRCTTTGTCID